MNEKRLEILLKLESDGKFEVLANQITLFPELYSISFYRFWNSIPDNLKYETAIDAYMNHGDSFSIVRKRVREALKYGKPDLPEWIKSQKEITIYRAGEEPIEKAKYRISWTTDIEKARWFLYEWNGRHAKYLYKGVISIDKIIAYTNERKEHEVMQYRNVRNIELLEQL